MSYTPIENEIFHVHTWRCGHAGEEQDQEYIDAAIRLGAKRITFTEHVPYVNDPFDWRMKYHLFEDYMTSMKKWKELYAGKIEVLSGFECEYLPSYLDYIWELKNMKGVDLLINGQHFYEKKNGEYSIFDEDKTYEFEGQFEGMVRGIEDGLFDVVAHPDRSFRASETLGEREMYWVRAFIEALDKKGDKAPYLEKNFSSMRTSDQYKEEFWECMPDTAKIVYGMDAHCVQTLIDGWEFVQRIKGNKE